MQTHLFNIISSIVSSFLHAWPYILLTIPLGVAVNLSGAARYINKALKTRPVVAILLAAVVGAFSPFCSCGVIPVITALLMGGVPLAPVMTFWIASPSMDPECFFLSVAMLGWKLAIWRLMATLVLSLSAGWITHVLMQSGWLGQQVLRTQQVVARPRLFPWLGQLVLSGWRRVNTILTTGLISRILASVNPNPAVATVCCAAASMTGETVLLASTASASIGQERSSTPSSRAASSGCGSCSPQPQAPACGCGCGSASQTRSFSQRLVRETWIALVMVVKFMGLAYLIKALISLYVPTDWIVGALGAHNPYAILTAATIGLPFYASNATALPMISGLLAQGMSPAAALAFLISGPITTLPAMAAVWGIAVRRVFALYVSFAFFGAIFFGYLYSLF